MTAIIGPDDIITELRTINRQSTEGIKLLADAEIKAINLQLELETQEAKSLLASDGNIPERQAIAKLSTQEKRFEAELAKAEVQRIKTKLRHLQDQQSNLQTQARMVELTWRTAGIADR